MTPRQEGRFGDFLAHYNRARADEGWGEPDLDLPFRPLRHRSVWNIRKRTFRRMARIVTGGATRGTALDVAAGNCWLSAHLFRWGFEVTALDINPDARDGLGAGRRYLDEGCRMLRVRAPVETMPFAGQSFDLVVASGGFHYLNGPEALAEFRRVLKSSGMGIVLDSPWYRREEDGDRAVSDRNREHRARYGIAGAGHDSSYLLAARFEREARDAGFDTEYFFPWTGFPRAWEEAKARMKGQTIARFPIILLGVRNG